MEKKVLTLLQKKTTKIASILLKIIIIIQKKISLI